MKDEVLGSNPSRGSTEFIQATMSGGFLLYCSQMTSANPKIAIPRPASRLGCEFCDNLTRNKHYSGTLHEYRTASGQTIPWIDKPTGIRLNRTVDFYADTGQTFTGDEIRHSDQVHLVVAKAKNMIAFTVASTQMKRYVLAQDPTNNKE